jgi:transmembrane sensor
MQENEEYKNLIDKLFKGNIKQEELSKLNEWYDSSLNDEELMVLTEKYDTKQTVKTRMLNKILDQIKPGEQKPAKLNFMRSHWKIAASIAFFLVASASVLYYSGIFNIKSEEIKWNEKFTKMGEKSILTLYDGTKIILNADSKFKYAQTYNRKTREVYLEGEAYFEVAHDPARPFIVHAGDISIKDMGTVFNISDYPLDDEISISLVEGKVKVTNKNTNADKNGVELRPLQTFVYNKKDEVSSIKNFDLQEEVGWKDNILKFESQPLNKIFKTLERSYGVNFELKDNSYGEHRISADFRNESVWTIIKVVANITNLKYRVVEDSNTIKKIIFYKLH